MWVRECDALLFDLDGVLIDSSHAVEVAWTEWMRRHDLDPRVNMHKVHGRRVDESIAELRPQCDLEHEKAWLVEFESTYTEGVTPLAGALQLLTSLPVGRWAIVTSGGPTVAQARVRAAGLPEPVVCVTGDDVRNGKPDPEGYLTGARLLGAEPSRCVFFEDVDLGLRAGLAAGMTGVGVLSRLQREQLPGAHAYVHDLRSVSVTTSGAQLKVHVAP